MKLDVMIFGAGPAGMMAASEFLNNKINFLVIEKEDVVGGLAKTLKYDDFLLDIGPHILCSEPYVYDFNDRIYKFIKNLLDDRLIDYKSISKKYLEVVQMGNIKFTYPIQITNALKNVGIIYASHIAYDYAKAKCKLFDNTDEINSYEQAIVQQLGRSLGDLFVLKYSEKIWGLPCSNLSSDLAWRVGSFSITTILRNQFYNYFMDFNSQLGHPVCYPVEGIGCICERMRKNIQNSDMGGFRFNSHPVELKHDGALIDEVVVSDCDNDNLTSYNPKYILSTIPINKLLGLLCPKPPSEILSSVSKLKYRSHICLFLIINKQNVMLEHCIYFPDPEIPFARIMEQKNYCNEMAPEFMTSLAVEFFCWEGDDLWIKNDTEILEIAINELEKLGLITRDKIVDYYTHKEKYAYPVYDLDYTENLLKVTDYLNRITNLEIIGRSGAFNYMGQYRAMEIGSNKAIEIVDKMSTV